MRKRAYQYAVALVTGLGAASLGVSAQHPRLIWNVSNSAPLGLYWLDGTTDIARGELVLAEPPIAARNLAAARDYLPAHVPLVKSIAATNGDVICSKGARISINGGDVATRLTADSQGRILPHWTGCRTLMAGDVFLLMEKVPASFDGRYFGVISRHAVIGRLTPLWIW